MLAIMSAVIRIVAQHVLGTRPGTAVRVGAINIAAAVRQGCTLAVIAGVQPRRMLLRLRRDAQPTSAVLVRLLHSKLLRHWRLLLLQGLRLMLVVGLRLWRLWRVGGSDMVAHRRSVTCGARRARASVPFQLARLRHRRRLRCRWRNLCVLRLDIDGLRRVALSELLIPRLLLPALPKRHLHACGRAAISHAPQMLLRQGAGGHLAALRWLSAGIWNRRLAAASLAVDMRSARLRCLHRNLLVRLLWLGKRLMLLQCSL